MYDCLSHFSLLSLFQCLGLCSLNISQMALEDAVLLLSLLWVLFLALSSWPPRPPTTFCFSVECLWVLASELALR